MSDDLDEFTSFVAMSSAALSGLQDCSQVVTLTPLKTWCRRPTARPIDVGTASETRVLGKRMRAESWCGRQQGDGSGSRLSVTRKDSQTLRPARVTWTRPLGPKTCGLHCRHFLRSSARLSSFVTTRT